MATRNRRVLFLSASLKTHTYAITVYLYLQTENLLTKPGDHTNIYFNLQIFHRNCTFITWHFVVTYSQNTELQLSQILFYKKTNISVGFCEFNNYTEIWVAFKMEDREQLSK